MYVFLKRRLRLSSLHAVCLGFPQCTKGQILWPQCSSLLFTMLFLHVLTFSGEQARIMVMQSYRQSWWYLGKHPSGLHNLRPPNHKSYVSLCCPDPAHWSESVGKEAQHKPNVFVMVMPTYKYWGVPSGVPIAHFATRENRRHGTLHCCSSGLSQSGSVRQEQIQSKFSQPEKKIL